METKQTTITFQKGTMIQTNKEWKIKHAFSNTPFSFPRSSREKSHPLSHQVTALLSPLDSTSQMSSNDITLFSNSSMHLPMFSPVFADVYVVRSSQRPTRNHVSIPHSLQAEVTASSDSAFSVRSHLFTRRITGRGFPLGRTVFSPIWFFHFTTFANVSGFVLSQTMKAACELR